jgi:hypothetical protein
MTWFDWVIRIGSVITALGIIWAAVTTTVKATIKKLFAPLIADIEELKKHSKENYLASLRLTIMSDDMPLGERICAARDYIKEGGNGEVKKFAINELHINEIHHHE